MSDGTVLGDWLAGLPAGPELAAALDSADPRSVPNGSIIQYLQACDRQLAHTEALRLAAIASVLERDTDAGADSVARLPEPDRFAPDEVRAALALTPRRAVVESEFAHDVCRALPAVHAEMLAGLVDRSRALVFAQHLAGLPGDLVAKVLGALLPEAPGLATGQLRARILKIILAGDPERARVTYEQALAGRAVVGYLNPDGTATITASGLPPDEAAAATERIAQLARAAKRAGHPGPVDQLRADIYLRLLDGRFHHLTRTEMIAALLAEVPPADTAETENSASARPDGGEPEDGWPGDLEPAAPPRPATRVGGHPGPVAGIEVRARLDSLAGVNELPGELPGWGPILASVTRRAVARQHRGQWRWVITDHDGYLITEGLTRHRPSTGPPTHHADGGIVELAIPATALARLTKDPPPEWAAVINDIATQCAHTRGDPKARLDNAPERRFPGTALRRHVQIRDRTCSAPGCRRPATQSEQDHTHGHQHGGATTRANLGPACHHDHQLKHDGGWRVAQPRPGRFTWTSPLGRRYHTRGERITEPEPPQPEPEPPPF
ncbi:hypothetical protein BKA01_004446 [Pseudonocardia eucalypti]|nr:hypothetical protein [Pseudonocardia eucalypti]